MRAASACTSWWTWVRRCSDLIVQGSTWDQLIAQVLEGRRSMVDDGPIKCAHGLTTFEEVLRARQQRGRLMQRFRYRALMDRVTRSLATR